MMNSVICQVVSSSEPRFCSCAKSERPWVLHSLRCSYLVSPGWTLITAHALLLLWKKKRARWTVQDFHPVFSYFQKEPDNSILILTVAVKDDGLINCVCCSRKKHRETPTEYTLTPGTERQFLVIFSSPHLKTWNVTVFLKQLINLV